MTGSVRRGGAQISFYIINTQRSPGTGKMYTDFLRFSRLATYNAFIADSRHGIGRFQRIPLSLLKIVAFEKRLSVVPAEYTPVGEGG